MPVLVMLIALMLASLVWGQDQGYPPPQGWVNDFAQVLDATTEAKLSALLADLERRTTVEMTVVVVSSTAPLTPKQYVVELFNRWGTGKRGLDNGVMILLAVQDRRVEVETGYGVEGILPDGRVGALMRSTMVPHFRTNQWSEGLLAGAQELARILQNEYQTAAEPTATARPASPGSRLMSALGWVYFLGWLGFLLWHRLRRRTLSYAVLALSALPGLLWLFWAFLPFIFPFILGVIIAAANVRARCPRCGRWLTRRQRMLQASSYAAPRRREIIYDCPACGYHDVDIVTLPSLRRVRTPTWTGGGAAWPGAWPGGRGAFGSMPGSGGSFKRFGGGSSGGGGAGASF